MDDPGTPKAKQEIRRRITALRGALDQARLESMSTAVRSGVLSLPEWDSSRYICTYISSKDGEVDTHGIIRAALDGGKRVCVPVIDPSSLELLLAELTSPDKLVTGHFGISEPDSGPRVPPGDIPWDLALVPGLAFDREGGRIGFGKGYYDRLLAARRTPRVALAFAFQLVDSVPQLAHDVPVDIIVTDKETIRIA